MTSTSIATLDASSISLGSISPTASSSHSSHNTNHQAHEPINLRIWKNNNYYYSRRSKLRADTSYHTHRLKKKSLRAQSSSDFNYTDSKRASDNETQSHHSDFILSGFQALKSNRILCDVTLVAQGKNRFL